MPSTSDVLDREVTSGSLLDLAPVIPVVVVHDLATAVPVARALAAGGVPLIELTLRSEDKIAQFEARREAWRPRTLPVP